MMENKHSDDAVTYLNNAGQVPLTESVKAVGLNALQRPPWEMHSDDQVRIRFGTVA
jgi:hypothetical protein